MQKGPVEDRCPAQQDVAGAGDEQRRRQAMQVRKYRRQHRVLRVRCPHVRTWLRRWRSHGQVAREAIQRENIVRVPSPAEVSHAGKYAQGRRLGQPKLLHLHSKLRRQYGAGRSAIDGDVFRLVCLQQLFVDGNCIVQASRKGMLRRQPIKHGHNFCLGQVGERDSLGQRAGIRIETAAMEIQ